MKTFECGCEFAPLPAFCLVDSNPLEPGWEVFDGIPLCQTKPCDHHKKYLWNVFHADGRPMERDEQL